jgi:hypothetical protein
MHPADDASTVMLSVPVMGLPSGVGVLVDSLCMSLRRE